MNIFKKQILSILEEKDKIAALANITAFLNNDIKDINWVGFYFVKNDELVLGPFQGNVACTRIPIGKGVCGTCVKTKKTLIVDNVHEFSGHIACDIKSNAEIVVPIIKYNKVLAVIDIDSPTFNRFKEDEKKKLELLASLLVDYL